MELFNKEFFSVASLPSDALKGRHMMSVDDAVALVNTRLESLVVKLEKLRSTPRIGLGCNSMDVVDAYNAIRPVQEGET